ncbi:uncharacterized protein LOC136083188 [Hydra vulgaris]|uniref:Uncharacterized protein LOC136083188 n=1 Tax=Hydra vulgaris TaxID=6087 RepID=A0ABM4CAH7_HYDVU
MKYFPSKPKEPLLTLDVPTRQWQKLGTDLFQKGIPEELVSDNGTQYSLKVFRQFSQQWHFKHITSSPNYAQSNGLAEATVKSIKLLIKKYYMSNEHIYKGILILRNTPIKCGLSPAELLHGRQLRDNLPRFQSRNKEQSKFEREIVKERVQFKKCCDKNIGAFEPYVYRQGQTVAIQNEVTREWSLRGKIIKCVAPRSYEVKLNHNGHILCRNQIQLRKVNATSASCLTRDNVAKMHRGQAILSFAECNSGKTSLELESENNKIIKENNLVENTKKDQRVRLSSGRRIENKIPLD